MERNTLLIVDDVDINREMLKFIFEEQFEILEAEDGDGAIELLEEKGDQIVLMFLDVIMPGKSGLDVLEYMVEKNYMEYIPVVIITGEASVDTELKAYEYGASDIVYKPFTPKVVMRRAMNIIELFSHRIDIEKKLEKRTRQLRESREKLKKNNDFLVNALSSIAEFKGLESAEHILRVKYFTRVLLEYLADQYPEYHLAKEDVDMIVSASALHDIGKFVVPDAILMKATALTPKEQAELRKHTIYGGEILKRFGQEENEFYQYCSDICRYHHERYDGRGYPDGLKGDEIPISAQIVALADVYDALTSERCYKKAFSHDVAVQMILDGKCGSFNPMVLECLTDIADQLPLELSQEEILDGNNRKSLQNVAQEMLYHGELTASERTLQLLEKEREKYSFFAMMSKEIQFEYNVSPSILTLTPWSAKKLSANEIIADPRMSDSVKEILGIENWDALSDKLRKTTRENPVVTHDCKIDFQGEHRWSRIVAHAMWSSEEPHEYQGAIGKVIDIHDTRLKLDVLEQLATNDRMTGLLNHASAKEQIIGRMAQKPDGAYALVIFDLDHFKMANDTYGHIFGDQVLQHTAEKLRQSIRGMDIAARVGGDEFLVFLEYTEDLEPIIERIFRSLTGRFDEFDISVSMGVARADLVGMDYETLFHCADQALYTVKRAGRGHYRFYDESMSKMLSVISPIDEGGGEGAGG